MLEKLKKLKPSLRPLPGGAKLSEPGILLATWFGSGLIKPASGTWGSIAALPFAALILWAGGQYGAYALALGMIIALYVGVWAANVYEKKSGEPDASAIVIDEVHGMWLALLPAYKDPYMWLVAFIFFRLFDIWKPWPASYFDKKMKGGWGVMLDDTVAGFYAMLMVILFIITMGAVEHAGWYQFRG